MRLEIYSEHADAWVEAGWTVIRYDQHVPGLSSSLLRLRRRR